MNKEQYLECLKNNLRNIPAEEINNIMQYYFEYFEDAGVENEQTVIAELGKPELLASKISADYVIKDYENNESIKNVTQVKKGISGIWIVILAICAVPVWLPLGIVAAVILFTFVIVVFSCVFAFAAASVAIVASGIFGMVGGIVVMFIHMPTGLATLGSGFFAIGMGSLILLLAIWFGNLFRMIIFKIAKIRIGKKGGK